MFVFRLVRINTSSSQKERNPNVCANYFARPCVRHVGVCVNVDVSVYVCMIIISPHLLRHWLLSKG